MRLAARLGENSIEVQGDQRQRVKKLLVELGGFREENILIDETIVET